MMCHRWLYVRDTLHSFSSSAFRCHQLPQWGVVKYQQMSQHLIFRPRGLYIDRPLGSEVGGWDVDLSGRRGVLRFGGWWDLALRGVLSLETHIDSPVASPACGEKYVQDQHVSSTLLGGNHTGSNGRKDRG